MAVNNGVMMQFFQWYTPANGALWNELAVKAKELADRGFTAVWFETRKKRVLVNKVFC